MTTTESTTEAELRATIEQQQVRIETLRRENEDLRRDIGIIADRLYNEAIERDWCDDYTAFVIETNACTTGEWLLPCRRNYNLTYTVSVLVSTSCVEDTKEEIKGSLADGWELDTAIVEDTPTVHLTHVERA